MKFKENDKVIILPLLDNWTPGEQYVGETGIILYAGTGRTVCEMNIVRLDDGRLDAFWPEELKLI